MTDIRNGVNAGKTITVHDTQITLNGWSGTGYTILDPESGAGAYMIGGGLDGGYTDGLGEWQKVLRNINLFVVTPLKGFLKLPLNPLRNIMIMLDVFIDTTSSFTECGLRGAAIATSISAIAVSLVVSTVFFVSLFLGPIGALIALAIAGQVYNRARKDAIGALAC
ncbi:hypothetical protein [uncultured Psychrobacter sp.]|uniref:hypothetical protein n=1 Tax=uncultured Psychrobacter sp. TaxID=259303 RepID=UPI00259199E1|nr:hypothetical protein [uncultured Psychrobacter sp.]